MLIIRCPCCKARIGTLPSTFHGIVRAMCLQCVIDNNTEEGLALRQEIAREEAKHDSERVPD